MKVKFKKLHPEAVIPAYAAYGDAGLDLTAISVSEEEQTLDGRPTDVVQFHFRTGLAVEIPEGYVGLIFPRSSVFKKSLRLSNCVGVIDSGYRGELNFMFDLTPNGLVGRSFYKPGDRIGQLVIMPYPYIEPEEAEELTATERGISGFGSSGN